MHSFPFLFSIFSFNLIFLVQSQQPYIGKAITYCSSSDNTSSAFGYSCNGPNKTCQAYITFRSIYPYNTVSSISKLFGADPTNLSQLNAASLNMTFDREQTILVPVTCSCSGQNYQVNTTYIVQPMDTPFIIANNTFQGLSTCQAIQAQNPRLTKNIYTGTNLTIPLRCACPTKNQTNDGFKYLLSYLVAKSQYVYLISTMFGVDTGRTLQANGLSEQDSTIYPFTTLLVPLKIPPSISQTIAPPPPPSPLTPLPSNTSRTKKSSNKTWVYVLIGALGGGLIVAIIGVFVFCVFYSKPKKKPEPSFVSNSFKAIEKQSGKEENEVYLKDSLESLSSIAQSFKVYRYDELVSATDNFSLDCWIKGSVYRGNFNGDFAVIKEVDGDVSEEINVLNKISHSNLIRLSGVCFNEGHWYLVYEYVINGSLSDWIFNKNIDGKFLNWTQRMQIALDVATGLNYIHNYTSPPFVHKDLNSSNVLLDGEFRAKIANFGLARSAEEGEFALTKHIVGTKGYLAPEYLQNGLISTKLDVYAFGVLLLEMLTGKEAVVLNEGKSKDLCDMLSDMRDKENGKEELREFMDCSMEGNYPLEIVVFVVKLAENCVKRDQSSRPGTEEIVQNLSRIMSSSLDWETRNKS